MNRKKAKLKFHPNSFEIVEEGDHVICAVSGKNIPKLAVGTLNYLHKFFINPFEPSS